ncbi:unnamed protein product, partial [Owenia fusiformis]
LFMQYKMKSFYKAYYQADIDYERCEVKKLYDSESLDQRFFWYLIQQSRKQSNTSDRIKNGVIFSNQEDVCEVWRTHFKTLATQLESNMFDNNFKIDVKMT